MGTEALLPEARGYMMALMVFMQNIHVFNCRSEKHSAFTVPIKRNPFILFASGSAIVLQIIVMEVDTLANFLKITVFDYPHLLLLLGVALLVFFLMEVYKKFRYKNPWFK